MRRIIITSVVILAAVLVTTSCKKITTKSYSCRCLVQRENTILDSKDYDLRAYDIYDAGAQCQDREYNINLKIEDEEKLYKCELY